MDFTTEGTEFDTEFIEFYILKNTLIPPRQPLRTLWLKTQAWL